MMLAAAVLAGACVRPGDQVPSPEIARVERRTMPSEVVATGTVRPQVGAQVNVGPRISGVLTKLGVCVGQHVRAGQFLAELDTLTLDVAVREAEAALKEAKAQSDLAASQFHRRKALDEAGLISREELETSRNAAVVATAAADRARCRLDAARLQRGYAEITAPIAGTVTAIATREGETVAASFAVPTFVTITDLHRLQVEASVDEVDIGRISVGQSARFTVDAVPDGVFEATVAAVTPQASVHQDVVAYAVVLTIGRGEEKRVLRPGMSASVSIVTGLDDGTLVIPARAIRRDADGRPYVLVAGAGAPVRRDISIGEVRGEEVRIREGLAEGSRVLVPNRDGGES